MALTASHNIRDSIFILLQEIIEQSVASNPVQQKALGSAKARHVGQIRCCDTVFSRPSDLFEHAKLHLWKNELGVQEFWDSRARGVPRRPDSQPSIFKYRELRRSEFRVLKALYPNEESDVLRFQMTHASLEHSPQPYAALSYCWGQDGRTTIIQVDDAFIEVSENVEHALKQLLACGHRAFYVDRLCINQGDLSEKGSQILMMGSIFRNAAEVSVWLGDAFNGSDRVMDLMRTWKSADDSGGSSHGATPWQHAMPYPPTIAEVDDFFEREYWSRSWIIQECIVAKQLKIYCGGRAIGWNYLARFVENCDRLERRPSGGPFQVANLEVVLRLVRSRESRLDGGPVSLLQALQHHRRSLVSKGHDKVFALLGLAHDCEQYVTSPQYSCSLRTMCLDLTRSFIKSSGKTALDIIFAAQRTPSPLWLPSWCPDYLHVKTLPFSDRTLAYLARQEVKFRLGEKCEKWDATMSCCLIVEDSEDADEAPIFFRDDSLFVRGVFVGRITNVNVAGRDGSKPANTTGYIPRRRPPVSDSAIFDQLSRLFMLYHPNYKKWARNPEALKYLFGDTMWRLLNHSSKHTRGWFKSMQNFEVFGKSLKVRAASSALHRWKNAMQSVAGPCQEAVWATDHRSMMTAVADLSADHLFLMTTDMGGVGWAEDTARIGDEVYLLHGCSMPVVLRREEPAKRQRGGNVSKKYTVVGYSIVDGWMDNERWNLARATGPGKTPSFDSNDTEWHWRWRQRQANRYCLERIEIV